jgi:hypothetical protein
VQLELALAVPAGIGSFTRSAGAETNGDQMPGYLLSGPRETIFAVVAQKLSRCLVRTANAERPAVKMHNRQPLEPIPRVGWVQRFCTVQYSSEDAFYFLSRQTILPYDYVLCAKNGCL